MKFCIYYKEFQLASQNEGNLTIIDDSWKKKIAKKEQENRIKIQKKAIT